MQSLFLAYLLYLTYEAPSVNLMKLLVKKEDRPTKKKNNKTAVKENGAEEEEEVEKDEGEGKGQKRKKVQ